MAKGETNPGQGGKQNRHDGGIPTDSPAGSRKRTTRTERDLKDPRRRIPSVADITGIVALSGVPEDASKVGKLADDLRRLRRGEDVDLSQLASSPIAGRALALPLDRGGETVLGALMNAIRQEEEQERNTDAKVRIQPELEAEVAQTGTRNRSTRKRRSVAQAATGVSGNTDTIIPTVDAIATAVLLDDVPGVANQVLSLAEVLRELEAGVEIDITEILDPRIARRRLPADLGGGTLLRGLLSAVHHEEGAGDIRTSQAAFISGLVNQQEPTYEDLARDEREFTFRMLQGEPFIAAELFPPFSHENLVEARTNEQQTIEFMQYAAVNVFGIHFDAQAWEETMSPTEHTLQLGEPTTPTESPYALGMQRVGTAMALQSREIYSYPETLYVAARVNFNAELLKYLDADGDSREKAELLKTLDRLRILGAKEYTSSDPEFTSIATHEGSPSQQVERLEKLAYRLALFSQLHEFGTRLPLLDDLALVPLLEPALQEGAIGRILPDIERSEPMSDEQLGNLMASLGNHLGKILNFIAMEQGGPYSEKGLGNRIRELQDGRRGWQSMNSGKNGYAYGVKTLSAIGLTTKVEIEEGRIRVALSDYGRDVGFALAGHLAALSERYPDIVLEDVLGQTATGAVAKTKMIETSDGDQEYRSRAALTRFKIFETLLDSDNLPLSQHELVERLGSDFDRSVVGNNLNILGNAGIIQYDTTSADRRYSYFEPVQNPPSDLEIHGVREKVVVDWIKTRNGPFTLDDFAKEPRHQYLMATYGETMMAYFADLVRQGLLTKPNMGFDASGHSAVWLTDKQRAFLTDFVKIFKDAQYGDEREKIKGKKLARDIIADKERYTALMKKAKHDSRQANAQARETSRAQVLSVVRDFSEISALQGIEADNVRIALQHLFGRKYSHNYVSNLLADLEEQGIVTVSQRRNKNYYRLASSLDIGSDLTVDASPTTPVNKDRLSGRWLAAGDAKVHERYDGSTLPAELEDQLDAQAGNRGKRRYDDPSYVEAVLDTIRAHPGISYMQIHALFEAEEYGMSSAMVRKIVYSLIKGGYVRRDEIITGKGFPLWANENANKDK